VKGSAAVIVQRGVATRPAALAACENEQR